MLMKLNLPPGMRDVGTAHQAKGRWIDGNLIRWVEGVMRPVGKWVRITSSPFEGRVNALRSMRDMSSRRWLAVGTYNAAYIMEGSTVIDVTPEDFAPGYDVTFIGGGYSAGPYNDHTYGTQRTGETSLILEANSWTFERWGEYFVATAISDGRVFVWRPGELGGEAYDERFQVIPNAPERNRTLIVTNERHLMLIAAGGDPRKIQWSSREDYNDWTPTATNLAGDLTLETEGTLQAAVRTGEEILVFSETDVFSIRYVGAPYAYGSQHVGTKCGVIGPKAAVVTNDFVAWMGVDGFYTYRGQVEPLPCDVWDFVFRDMNYRQRAIVASGHNGEFSEVWWFFPAGEVHANARYVIWNYRDNTWAKGYMPRTAWQARGILQYPVAAGVDGHIYEQEHPISSGSGHPRSNPYVVSAPYELGNGDRAMVMTSLIPDRDSAELDAVQFTFEARYAPRLSPHTYGPFLPDETGYTPVRFTGREVSLRVESRQDVDWRLGVLRAEVKQGGGR